MKLSRSQHLLRVSHSLAILGLCLCAAACDKTSSTSPPDGSAAAAEPPPSASEPEVAAPSDQPAPPDLDVADLQKELGCSGKKGKRACLVVAEFAKAGRWTLTTASGEGRWIGKTYTIEKGVEKQEWLILRAKRVPTAQVGPTELPLMIGMGPLPEEYHAHGTKLIAALSQAGAGKKNNQALQYVERFTPRKDEGAVNTAGASVQLVTDDQVYLRQKSTRKLLVVSRKVGLSATPGDGTYGQLWLAVW